MYIFVRILENQKRILLIQIIISLKCNYKLENNIYIYKQKP